MALLRKALLVFLFVAIAAPVLSEGEPADTEDTEYEAEDAAYEEAGDEDSCEPWKQMADSEYKSSLWSMISMGDDQAVQKFLEEHPCAPISRAADGRGPLFWAYEFDRPYLVNLLKSLGADPDATDLGGMKPAEMYVEREEEEVYEEEYEEEEESQYNEEL